MPRTAEGGPHIAWPLITIFASLWLYFLMTRATRENQNRELGIILSNFLLSLPCLWGWQLLDYFCNFLNIFHEVLTCSLQFVSLRAIYSITKDQIP